MSIGIFARDEFVQTFCKRDTVLRLALPHRHDLETAFYQLRLLAAVAFLVRFDFRAPVVELGFWQASLRTVVTVPVAAVDEDRLPAALKDDVGFAGQLSRMQPIPKAHSVEKTANHKLRTSVLCSNGFHDPPTLIGRSSVGHRYSNLHASGLRMAKTSSKIPVFRYLFEQVVEVKDSTGSPSSRIVTSDALKKAMSATKSDLSTNNPANFLKDYLRSNTRNEQWIAGVAEMGWTARQKYGKGQVFEFVETEPGQTEPFPDPFDVSSLGDPREIETVSLDSYARTLGRPDESWLIQTAVSQRIIETHFALTSELDVTEVHHLQNSLKLTPEIDAIFLLRFKVAGKLTPQTAIVTLEAKRDEIILVEQIKEQIAKIGSMYDANAASEVTTIVALALRSFGNKSDRRMGLFEMKPISVSDAAAYFKAKRAWEIPIEISSQAAYRFIPSVSGI